MSIVHKMEGIQIFYSRQRMQIMQILQGDQKIKNW